MKKLGLLIASLILVNLSTWAQNEYPFKKEVQTDVPGVTETRYFDVRTGKYVSKKEFKRIYGISPSAYYAHHKITPSAGTSRGSSYRPYKWKLKTTNTVVGTCMIGCAATTAFLSSAIISKKAEDLYNTTDYGDTQRIINYTCAGVSLAGVIVILTGLHKEYSDGIKVADNWVIKDNGAGLSLSCKF